MSVIAADIFCLTGLQFNRTLISHLYSSRVQKAQKAKQAQSNVEKNAEKCRCLKQNEFQPCKQLSYVTQQTASQLNNDARHFDILVQFRVCYLVYNKAIESNSQ